MRFANRIVATTLAAALVLSLCVNSVHAGKSKHPSAPPPIPALYNGEIFDIVPGNNDNVVGIDNEAIATTVANPLYVVDGQEVSHVLSIGLGAGYNPYWDIVLVTVLNGRDLSTDPFLSEAEILDAAANGEVALDDTGFILLCQVVGR
jgi:hypothetical protein